MTLISTVTGTVESAQLGCTLIHEHLCIRTESIYYQFPHLYDEEAEFRKAVEQVEAAKKHGVQTICDPTIMELGRDIRFMEKVAAHTGMQVIAATGIYTYHHLIPPHFQNRDIDYMAGVFVRDIEVGIQNTSIKAGFLKCAANEQFSPDVEKVTRAVARAHHLTGVPIMTHSHPASGTGLTQLNILEEEGVKPERLLIGHSGDTENLDYLLAILDRGAFIGMDRYGVARILDADRRNATLIELLKRGYAGQMFLSHDYCCSNDANTPEYYQRVNPKWTMTYLFDEIIPDLIRLGVKKDQIHTMLFDNVKRWFEKS